MESAPNARLIIRKLSLENFKSYAGCVELGPFHKVSSENCEWCVHVQVKLFISIVAHFRNSAVWLVQMVPAKAM